MRWADAMKASKVSRAERPLTDPDNRKEPNVILIDPRFSLTIPKAFHVREPIAWQRVPLRHADEYGDWEPDRSEP